jgi:hypothetical protein
MGLSEQYQATMETHDMGTAMYQPTFASEMRPGTCGFLDDKGNWVPLFDLTDSLTLQLSGMTAPEGTAKSMPAKEIETGPDKPLVGMRMSSTRHEFSVEPPLAATGIPASCSFWWEFEAKTDIGAVLICPFPLSKQGYYESGDWEDWAKENARAIVKKYKSVKSHPMWIVTTTYTTKQALIDAWEGKDNTSSIGFSVGVEDIVDLSPSVAFERSSKGSNWRKFPPTVCCESCLLHYSRAANQLERAP